MNRNASFVLALLASSMLVGCAHTHVAARPAPVAKPVEQVAAKPEPKKSHVRVTAEGIEIDEQIQFDIGRSTILTASDPLLTDLADAMKEHVEITTLIVEGHTSNDGSAHLNRKLSRERAESVKEWLTAHGIAANRVATKGYGESRPIATNDREENREKNRRVDFKIGARSL